MSVKAIECKACGSKELHHGAYCRICWRMRDRLRKRKQPIEDYEPRVLFAEGMPCPGCQTPITAETRYQRYTLCQSCGQKKATDRLRKWRGGQKRPPQRRPPSNPIVVVPRTHRAKGQSIPPPAPKIEVKPEAIIVPPHITVTSVESPMSRWEHGGRDIWTPASQNS